ncbi:hypothetical protein [Sphingomonas melonis]|nr:hypothetical protein [Sphingomonas melonis]
MTPAPAPRHPRLKIAAIIVVAILCAPITIVILIASIKAQGNR